MYVRAIIQYNTQECTCIVYSTSAMAKDEKFEDAVDWEKFKGIEDVG